MNRQKETLSLITKFYHAIIFLCFWPQKWAPSPKNLWNDSKQCRNWAQFDLLCFQSLGARFGGAKGGVLCLHHYLHFKKSFVKNSSICTTGLETGCKPVMLMKYHALNNQILNKLFNWTKYKNTKMRTS